MTSFTQSFAQPLFHRQRGAVLFVSLIILLLMTIIGVSAIQNTTLQEKMAGNLRDANLAFQAAEAGLRDAEKYLATTTALPIFSANCGSVSGDNNGLCSPASASATYQQWENSSYWSDSDKTRRYGAASGAVALPQVSKQPRYMIEELVTAPLDPTEAPDIRYRSTAQGYGIAATNQAGSGTDPDKAVNTLARVMLQTIYKR